MESPRPAELLSAQLTANPKDPVYESALRAAVIFLAAARSGEPLSARNTQVVSAAQELGG